MLKKIVTYEFGSHVRFLGFSIEEIRDIYLGFVLGFYVAVYMMLN